MFADCREAMGVETSDEVRDECAVLRLGWCATRLAWEASASFRERRFALDVAYAVAFNRALALPLPLPTLGAIGAADAGSTAVKGSRIDVG